MNQSDDKLIEKIKRGKAALQKLTEKPRYRCLECANGNMVQTYLNEAAAKGYRFHSISGMIGTWLVIVELQDAE